MSLPLISFAQEGSNPNNEGYETEKQENQYEKYTPNIDLEGKVTLSRTTNQQDSIIIKPAPLNRIQPNAIPVSPEKEQEKTNSSFNIFYYMFQKFKLGDIIDQ
ncbi:MAG TPA: hypothetical protein PKC24_00435 [Cyclobacteriaceae bacterium]|nr:hypothetical protein [Cyclobacteriaceae bacterium]